jgi:hypothetical protein
VLQLGAAHSGPHHAVHQPHRVNDLYLSGDSVFLAFTCADGLGVAISGRAVDGHRRFRVTVRSTVGPPEPAGVWRRQVQRDR